MSNQAVIIETQLGAAHDGRSELIVFIRHPNGSISEIPLEEDVAVRLFERCGASSAAELVGREWHTVRDALADAYGAGTGASTRL